MFELAPILQMLRMFLYRVVQCSTSYRGKVQSNSMRHAVVLNDAVQTVLYCAMPAECNRYALVV